MRDVARKRHAFPAGLNKGLAGVVPVRPVQASASAREPASCRDPMNNQRTTSMRRVRRAHLLRSSHVATSLHAFAPNGVHTFVTPASSGSLSIAKGCAELQRDRPTNLVRILDFKILLFPGFRGKQRCWAGWARRGPARRRAAESRST